MCREPAGTIRFVVVAAGKLNNILFSCTYMYVSAGAISIYFLGDMVSFSMY